APRAADAGGDDAGAARRRLSQDQSIRSRERRPGAGGAPPRRRTARIRSGSRIGDVESSLSAGHSRRDSVPVGTTGALAGAFGARRCPAYGTAAAYGMTIRQPHRHGHAHAVKHFTHANASIPPAYG